MFLSYKKKKKQQGYALILALFVAAFFMTMSAITSRYTIDALQSTRRDFQHITQAKNVAEAGLQEAAFWFEKQTSFTSKVDITGTCNTSGITTGTTPWCDGDYIISGCTNGTPINVPIGIPCIKKHHMVFKPIVATSVLDRGDTDDAKGLVRDIVIDKTNNLYGHYEILRYDPSKWVSTAVDRNSNTAVMDISDEKLAQLDISGNNINIGTGRYWRIISTGTLYRRLSGETGVDSRGVFVTPYTSLPQLGKYTLSENILKISYTDQRAAILLNNCSKFTTFTNSLIQANSDSSIKCGGGTLLSSIANDTTNIKGGMSTTEAPFTTESIFGITAQEINGIANQRESDATKLKRDEQGRLGSNEIIYLEGSSDFKFGVDNPLKGGGVLYVNDGNLTLDSGAGGLFTGVIYLRNGNLTIKDLNSINGSIFLENGTLIVDGTGDKVDIGYNNNVMTNLMKSISVYKEDSLSYKSISVK